MALACRLCIMTKGLRGSEIGNLPNTEDELADHIEQEHAIIVKRPGEDEAVAEARYYAKFPDRAPRNA